MRGKKAKQIRRANVMNEACVLQELQDWWMVQENIDMNACILAARVSKEVLDHYGIRHRIFAVQASAMNRQRIERLASLADDDDGMTFIGDEYAVGANEGTIDANGFAGHLIVVTAKNFLIDLTNYQFDRPEHGIVTGEEQQILRIDNLFTDLAKGHRISIELEQGRMHYTPMDTTVYTQSPDWRISGHRLGRAAIDKIAVIMKINDSLRALMAMDEKVMNVRRT